MASLPESVTLVQDYMYHLAAVNNDPFGSNYADALAPYVIDVTATTNALVPDNVSWQIYSASDDAQTAFLL